MTFIVVFLQGEKGPKGSKGNFGVPGERVGLKPLILSSHSFLLMVDGGFLSGYNSKFKAQRCVSEKAVCYGQSNLGDSS